MSATQFTWIIIYLSCNFFPLNLKIDFFFFKALWKVLPLFLLQHRLVLEYHLNSQNLSALILEMGVLNILAVHLQCFRKKQFQYWIYLYIDSYQTLSGSLLPLFYADGGLSRYNLRPIIASLVLIVESNLWHLLGRGYVWRQTAWVCSLVSIY